MEPKTPSSPHRTAPEWLLGTMQAVLFVFDADTLTLTYANDAGQSCLGGAADFSTLFPDVRWERVVRRLARGQGVEFVRAFPHAPGAPTYRCTVRKVAPDAYLVEGQDHAATLETEALLKSYAGILERNKAELERERKRVERLLFNTLPAKCVEELRTQGGTNPERFPDVSVLFLDFVDFTRIAQGMTARDLFGELNEIFTAFDEIVIAHRCERIKTMGDAYLAVCGMPETHPQHPELLASAAVKMRQYITQRNAAANTQWSCRIGIHTGEVTGGVVGTLKYIYDIFGDGVNTASRMESHAEPMTINLSAQTRARLGEAYRVTPRGSFDVKGKGDLEMYYLDAVEGAPVAHLLQAVTPREESALGAL